MIRYHHFRRTAAVAVLAIAVLATACGDADSDATSAPTATTAAPKQTTAATEPPETTTALPPSMEVTLLTHDSFLVPDGVWEAFRDESGITVTVLQGGDAGTVVNQAILTKGNPTADVLFGIDNTFLSRGVDEALFIPYESGSLDRVPDELELDAVGHVTPISFGDVCLNYEVAAFADSPLPQTLGDLADPRYRGQLVVQNPATSSPGLAFLLATIAAFPDEASYTWQDYWRDLRENDVLITDGWETAYYGEFSGGSGTGDRPLVVSYASSPPAEVIFADPRPESAPTGVITDGCFRQIEFAGILAGSERVDAAQHLIDFMLSRTFQDEIALNMFVFPAAEDANLPPEFVDFTTVPSSPLAVAPDDIEANRDRWIAEWTELMR